ncbi:NACHT domain-containing protein [Chryseobacterium mucoviscidosis]|uniref:NACHT domain-containing protein n=1 Tax=Chryseobacterium mucoviscidosis TaxID=1945581 RepID=UPI00301A94D6
MEGSASQAGFYYQNNVAALKIIEFLFFNSDISQIKLENYDQGNHIDDIIVYREERIEYYQVKWSEDEEKSYTIHSMLKSENNAEGKITKKSLFKQLAEGYLSVRNKSKEFSITLFTTKKESNQKRPSDSINFGLTDLRTNVIESLGQSVSLNELTVYEEYKSILDKIQAECGLDDNSFDEFLRSLNFKFRQDGIDEIQSLIRHRLDTLGIEIDLMEKLLNAAVKWSITGEGITKEVVFKELGISDRFNDKISHFFKVVDDDNYVVNQPFFKQLRRSLSELSSGYIFIEGLPGIGKSTALTKFKEEEPSATLTYYCFIPDISNNFGELRHKSIYFLKSLCISIEKQFLEVDLPGKFSTNFEEKFLRYLNKLSELNRKIIFIIDGLDHVHRDSTVGESSLLNVIKGSLPENIFFILSSQYSSVLTPSVKQMIDSDSRRHIIVHPFSQPDIVEYLQKKGIQDSEIVDKIEQVSGGIPIYLHYISELLLKVDINEYSSILEEFPQLKDGEINSFHKYLFQKISDDSFSKWVLAVFAYRKENTSIETLHQILFLAGENRSITEVEDVVNSYSHLLKQIDGRSYSIFHNSFREFIISKTPDLKIKFNNALVEFYKENPYSDEAYRNYFSHLYEIGDYDTIISCTSLEYVKSGWENYRSQKEIKENLDIAIRAAIEKASMTEFIRIAFIKDQFSQAIDNMDNSEIDITMLLLNSGHIANSLRTIWDGDFVLANKEYFCNYIGKYYHKTGNLLPMPIIKQGLSKSISEKKFRNLTIEFKAEALVKDNILEIFNSIDDIKWIQSNKHSSNFKQKHYSKDINLKTNKKIKSEILDYLVKHNQFKKLYLLKTELIGDDFYPEVQMSLVNFLLPISSQRKEAVSVLKSIDFTKISDKHYTKFVISCSKFLTNEEILQLFPSRDIEIPKLFDKVIDDKFNKFEIRKEIVSLFDCLKYFWIFTPDLIEELKLKASYFHSPAEEIYDSIFTLSEIWNESRLNNLNEYDLMASFKDSIDTLYIPRPKEFRPRARGLFDMDSESSFVASDIKTLFKDIFELAIELLSQEKIQEITDFWIEKDKSGDGYRHYSVGLQIAKSLSKSINFDLKATIGDLIRYAEEVARLEHDTITLTTYLGKVCDTFGKCGFQDDFQRLYKQLIDSAFGVGHRKDYRAINIIDPLKMYHEIDPEGTLSRLANVLHIQDQLRNAGNGRMGHISLSNLIRFTSQIYPSLGFKLMEFEESRISRNEGIEIVVKPIINNCDKTQIRFLLALLKTLQRWRDGSSSESTFLSLAKSLLLKAIEFRDDEMISKIMEIVKFNTVIELDDKKALVDFTKILTENGLDLDAYNLQEETVEIQEELSDHLQENPKKKTGIKEEHRFHSIESIHRLFTEDFEGFNSYLEQEFERQSRIQKAELLKREKRSINNLFFDFYKDHLSQDQKKTINDNKYLIVENYESLKNDIINFVADGPNKFKEFKSRFFLFVNELDNLFTELPFERYLQKNVDIEGWLKNIYKNINWRRDHVFYRVLTDSDVTYLVDNCSIFYVDKLLEFVNKWTSRTIRSAALLKIANKLMPLDVEKAKEVISQVSEYEFDSLLFQHEESSDKLEFDIFETIFNADVEYGRRFLLKSYYVQKGKYSGDMTDSLKKLFKYKKYYEDSSVQAYYDGNLNYNKGLAFGLPEIKNKYEFVTDHNEQMTFSEIIIHHLVWLFNYPAVKIRELSLQSTFDLILEDDDLISLFIQYSIIDGNKNEIEYAIVVLQAIALSNPQILIKYKNDFIKLLKYEHVNILEGVKDLLYIIQKSDTSFLKLTEKQHLDRLNVASPLILRPEEIHVRSKSKFIYSLFQFNLIYKLNENDDEENFTDSVYSELVSKGWGDYDQEDESNVHQNYNINSNFDVIEVQSPYYDEIKEAINKVFYNKIKRGCFEMKFVDVLKRSLRIFDPSQLLINITTRPPEISFINENLSESDFLMFSDFDEIVSNISNRNSEYVTLVDFGSQRAENYKKLSGTCYFEVKAFLKHKNYDLKNLTKGDSIEPFLSFKNKYAYEVPSLYDTAKSFPNESIFPLLQISYNKFRGENGLINANIFNDVFSELGISSDNLLQIYKNSNAKDIQAFNWISSYTGGPTWRRFKPSSEGFTLRIKKDILSTYMKNHNLELCYRIILRRSTDNDRMEKYMNWFDFEKDIVVQ